MWPGTEAHGQSTMFLIGLVGPVIRQLANDGNNDVWVATSTGVSKISDHSVSINEENIAEYAMYPNPATDKVVIEYPESSTEDAAYIFNASMQLIEMVEFTAGAKKIQFSVAHIWQVECILSVRTELTKKLIHRLTC